MTAERTGTVGRGDDDEVHDTDVERPLGLHPYPGMDRDRRWAVITGFLGAVLAILAGFLPVHQDTTRVQWTAGPDYASVTAPLVSGRPLDLTITAPCAPLAQVPENTIVFSTLPEGAPGRISDGLVVQRAEDAAGDPVIEVAVRNITLLSVPLSTLRDPACETLNVRAETGILVAEFTGLERDPDDADDAVRAAVPGTMRPQVTGVFTDLTPVTAPDGLGESTVEVTVDSRYSSSPTALKLVLMVIGVLATLASVVFLHRLDGIDGRSHRRFVPRSWSRLSGVDGVVIGVLGFWHLVGANTSDDGYLLTMARSAGPSGYMANYFRWLGSPESPVGWYYEILRVFAEISTASPWMRLPTLLCGILSWLIISREVVPRLGRLARTWRGPRWTGAALFLAFWMAFNNGLRPEPVIALGALLTWSLVERSIATRRLVPGVAAIGVAAFSLGAGPTGLMCVAALAAGAREFLSMARRRARVVGWAPILGPVLAVGLALLYTVFADQTLAAVLEATRIRTELGPSLPWYGEKERWEALFGVSADGGVARRFPVLLMLMCLVLVTAVMLRRGKIPGAAAGPSRRLIGVLAGSLLFLVFTPTKWTHHFGVFAGLAGALAVLAVIALRSSTVSLNRSRWLVWAALCFVVGLSTATNNTWWYVSDYGIPFSDSFPAVGGVQVQYVAFIGALVCLLIAGLIHSGLVPSEPGAALWRRVRRAAPFLRTHADTPAARRRADGRSRGIGGTPLTVVAFSVVIFELVSAVTAVFVQSPAYSVGRGNIRALSGEPCALADSVLVEEDSNDGLLSAVGAGPEISLGAGVVNGFAPNGLPDSITVDSAEASGALATSESGERDPGDGVDAGTTGGRGAVTVNGSTVALPFGLDPDTTPVLGSYRRGPQVAAELTSAWYELPARGANRPLLVMAAAGRIGNGALRIEYGRPGRVGATGPTDFEVMGSTTPIDVGPAPAWRNLRIPLDSIPEDAQVVRVVAADGNLDPDQWLAVTPPRNPRLRTLDEVVGHTDPVLIDWVVALAFPCQRPFVHNGGVAEIPRYRILADRESSSAANWWQSAGGGGPLLWTRQTVEAITVPTYLDHDWARDWGSLQRFEPLDPDATPAELLRGSEVRWGWTTPGPMN
ncbi:arabinosyltransferase domain-containing protein [Dietzia cinnamea]|uniref:Arabinosyltransferase domain-containing protein n=2 Tax=Dietzia TaxID=37914 RepID=A0AAW5QCU8_9ACTN|nr:arabinosyltransferase domain-containing protein [Dietzia cinnamea]PWD96991.1 arabinosyltransferase [Dietzia maris]MCT1641080.1 arabinosyltransferase domain-containing protein [Dietzia cinnamea]MCT1711748.1 arabinosyltransferase domain-containing protein [Dietzia cinnamea]MCT1865314.1 arabinosyltransferase domain-containing protein [Dietzia cinnamea]MCT2031348.1 arabinosyltransferase domain-containing protein [Dietzia cinnamea]